MIIIMNKKGTYALIWYELYDKHMNMHRYQQTFIKQIQTHLQDAGGAGGLGKGRSILNKKRYFKYKLYMFYACYVHIHIFPTIS